MFGFEYFRKYKNCLLMILCLIILLGFDFLDTNKIKATTFSCTEHNVWGYAWSETIGWISFSCADESAVGTGIDYGVDINEETGIFSGYAWSDNIGWVNFAPNGPYPESPDYSVKLVNENQVSGWARACAGTADPESCAGSFSVDSVSGTSIDGNVHTNPMTSDDQFMYLVGSDNIPGDKEWRIEKRDKTTGELIEEFGSGGVVQENPSPGSSIDIASSVAVDSDYIYIAGHHLYNGLKEWRIEKRDKTTGDLVEVSNSRTNVPAVGGDVLEIKADQEGDFIYIIGSDRYTIPDYNWRVEKRYKSDLSPDDSFGFYGTLTDIKGYPQALYEEANFLYIGGYEFLSGGTESPWRLEKISKSNGDVSWAATSTVHKTASAYLMDIDVDSNYVYSSGRAYREEGGIEYGAEGSMWRIEKRDKNNGNLISGFGDNGVITHRVATALDDYALSIVVDDSYLYIAGVQEAFSATKWRIEKRNKTTGELIEEFGINGAVVVDFPGNSEWLVSIDIIDNYILLFGNDFTTSKWIIEKRSINNGSLNWAGDTDYPATDLEAAAVYYSNPDAGGWDGWIKLDNNEISIDKKTGIFSGYAWGDEILGWISFSGTNYEVITSYPYNVKPDTITIDDMDVNWAGGCEHIMALPAFHWTYTDQDNDPIGTDPQTAYEIRIDNDTDFTTNVLESSGGSSISYTPAITTWLNWEDLEFNTNYYWQVRVKDSNDNWSDWSDIDSFTTPRHSYPLPSFIYSPLEPVQYEEVDFNDESICYDSVNNPYSCNLETGGVVTYEWYFDDGNTSSVKGDVIHSFNLSDDYTVTLNITDDLGTCSTSTSISATEPLPEYKEVPAFIRIKDFLASVVDALF